MRLFALLTICAPALLAACAADVPRVATGGLAPPASDAARIVRLHEDVELVLATGYTRMLRRGSRWASVGSVPQGEVYRLLGDVFTVEGAHVHEAHIVLAGGRLVGFYLPVERAFSPLKAPIPVPSGVEWEK